MYKLILLVAVASAALLGGTATAAGEAASRADRIVFKDCRDGKLDRSYGLVRLRRAQRHLGTKPRSQTPCLRTLRAAIRRAETEGILRGCLSPAASRRQAFRPFKTKALRRALRRFPADVRQYSDCPAVIRKEIRRRP